MCGFVVVLDRLRRRVDRTPVERAVRAIRHRGPDDEAYHWADGVGFGFRRLSIIDLSPEAGQPMHSADGRLTIVYNGEIYNYVELRDELLGLGYRFRTHGDTEVLLTGYEAWGESCLTRLNGMWAFVIHDRRRGCLFGSRDRLGIKPLYRYGDAERVVLASEVKAIRATGWYRPEWAPGPAADFLVAGHANAGSSCLYRGIEQIEPGTWFVLQPDGQFRKGRFWSVPEESPDPAPNPGEELAGLLDDAVRLRLRSDVPVGVLLSGGIDSTAITCSMASRHPPDAPPILAFSFNTPQYDESALIADTVQQTGVRLVPLETNESRLYDSLPDVITAQDEPVHSLAAVIVYHLMRLARDHGVPVVLNGGGADEVLAGYESGFPLYWESVLRQRGARAAYLEIAAYCQLHGGSPSRLFRSTLRRSATRRLRRFRPYRWAAKRFGGDRVKDSWFEKEFEALAREQIPAAGPDPLNQALRDSLTDFPLPLYLRTDDRSSMAHSVELRAPFLDYRLVSMAARLPGTRKMAGPWNKILLRDALRGRIPESVLRRPVKWGFALPSAEWVAGPLYGRIEAILGSRATRERGIYRVDRIRGDLERHRRGEVDIATNVMRIAQFEMWCELVGIG